MDAGIGLDCRKVQIVVVHEDRHVEGAHSRVGEINRMATIGDVDEGAAMSFCWQEELSERLDVLTFCLIDSYFHLLNFPCPQCATLDHIVDPNGCITDILHFFVQSVQFAEAGKIFAGLHAISMHSFLALVHLINSFLDFSDTLHLITILEASDDTTNNGDRTANRSSCGAKLAQELGRR